MPKKSHPHRLKKHKYPTGNTIFFCTLPDCHFKIEAALALGKRAICNICGDEFIMNEYSLKLVKPHCPNCGKVKVKDPEGKDRYVRKVSSQILTGIAADSTNDLRNRLSSAVATADKEDEDI